MSGVRSCCAKRSGSRAHDGAKFGELPEVDANVAAEGASMMRWRTAVVVVVVVVEEEEEEARVLRGFSSHVGQRAAMTHAVLAHWHAGVL